MVDQDYNHVSNSICDSATCAIDIEVNTSNIPGTFKTVYAIAMVVNDLDMEDFLSQAANNNTSNISDITIRFENIAIVIEVKIDSTNCKQQLYNQIKPLMSGSNIIPVSYSWQKVVKLLEKTKHVENFVSHKSIFVSDLLQTIERGYPGWFEAKPFSMIPYSSDRNDPNYVHLCMRMREALNGLKADSKGEYSAFNKPEHVGFEVPFNSASEVWIDFNRNENGDENVVVYIWPGVTKDQGSHLFNNNLYQGLSKTSSPTIDGILCEITVKHHMRLYHYQQRIVEAIYSDQDINNPKSLLQTYSESGVKKRADWPHFKTNVMDSHFQNKFDWERKFQWHANFEKTTKKELSMNMGYGITLIVPYDEFQNMDNTEQDITKVTAFIKKIADEFKRMIP